MANPPPFTRLPVTGVHPSASAAINDIYDKLQALTQALNTSPSSPAPTAPGSAANIRNVTSSVFLLPTDSTLSFRVSINSSAVLNPASGYPNQAFTIQNTSGSSATVNLQSPTGELINGAVATSYVLSAGQAITISPVSGGWSITGQV